MGLFQRIWRIIVSQLSNESKDNADCETFPATPGLLTTYILKDSLPIGRRRRSRTIGRK